ncbi:5-formyltetrahydrofolate cyclo-ligase [Copidosoma floridanum]|uniref:5-formyltetrahydrofolate cyclo-ligase n=1 Tax=Copidosoma floridanum TaxID=29053 RepID=UPI0006C93F24|nr:5-formyltetrahydrofolate cyclo-ligase [Copidosoma floridanum]
MSTNLRAAKAQLREKVKNILESIDVIEKKRQSQVVYEKLMSLPQYNESRRISIYLSTSNEIDTISILKDIFAKGKEAFVPRYNKNKMEMVQLYSMEDFEKLPLTKWNIKQPAIHENREDPLETGGLDLMILPGMAFTKNGKRLGHGMGYYDKYLESIALHKKQMPYLIALAFKEQLFEDIPTNEKDIILNTVLTE